MDGVKLNEMRTAEIRTFDTGATRTGGNKPEYAGYFSALSMLRYGQYMFQHQIQADGSFRNCRNYQLGIDSESYEQSRHRHNLDAHLHHEGYGSLAVEDEETSLCAIIFNAQGKLHEILKKRFERDGKI